MKKKRTVWYIIFLLMIVFGYLTREVIIRCEEVTCPRCTGQVAPMSLSDRLSTNCPDVKCDSCGYLFPLQSDRLLGVHYWSYNKEEIQDNYNHYNK